MVEKGGMVYIGWSEEDQTHRERLKETGNLELGERDVTSSTDELRTEKG